MGESTEALNRTRIVGRVRKRFDERGYGFLQVLGSKDIFFHANDIKDHSFKSLNEGDWLEFEVVNDGNGRLRAKTVRLITEEEIRVLRERGELDL